MRLSVLVEERLGPANVRPLGESLTPPRIVLWNLMKLGQIEGSDRGPGNVVQWLRTGVAIVGPVGAHPSVPFPVPKTISLILRTGVVRV